MPVEPCQSCVHKKMFKGQLMVTENEEGRSFFEGRGVQGWGGRGCYLVIIRLPD